MTYKNAKTILFAGLIAAMILPFSGMNFAGAEEQTNIEKVSEKDAMLAAGYELYPGGWIKKDRIKADLIYVDNPNNRDEIVLDANAMKKQYNQRLKEAGITAEQNMGLSAITSYHIAAKDDPSNNITYSRAYWNVPDSPATYDDGTNYNFNAVEPYLGANIILQPVLQHGFSSWCDAGDNWVTYPFMLIYGNPIGGSCVSANEGNLIRGIISEGSYNTWTVSIKNYANSVATDSVSLILNDVMTAEFMAVETWNIPTNCNELEGDVEYKYLLDYGDVDSWSELTQGSIFCGMDTNIVSNTQVQFNNDN